MAKGAANEQALGALHSTLTRVFTQVLAKYEKQYEALTALEQQEVSVEMLELIAAIGEPSPAMLSAVAKFLKDNEVLLDTGELDELSSQERRLKEMRERRGNVVSFKNMPLVEGA